MLNKALFIGGLLVVIILSSLNPALALGNPFGADTEIYYEARLSEDNVDSVLGDTFNRLREIEQFDAWLEKIKATSGIDIEKDIISWMGDRLMFGFVGTPDGSPVYNALSGYLRYVQLKEDLAKTVSQIRALKTNVETYRQKNGKLPEWIRYVIPQDMKAPRGGYYTYRLLKDGNYEILAPEGQFTELGLYKNEPRYHSTEGFSGDVPKIKYCFSMKNFLLAIQVKDSDGARAAFEKFKKMSDLEFEKVPFKNSLIFKSKKVSYTFYSGMVLLSDNAEVLKSAVVSFERPDKSIEASPVYAHFRRDCAVTDLTREIFFVNFSRIHISSKMLRVQEPVLASLINSLYCIGYKTEKNQEGVEVEMRLLFNPDKQVPVLKKYFAQKNEFPEGLMENLPAGLPVVVSYNIGEAMQLLTAVGDEEPKLKREITTSKEMFRTMLGMDFMDDVVSSTTGEVALTYKTRDFLINAIESIYNEIKHKKGAGMDASNMKETGERVLKGTLKIEKLPPMTFFVGIRDKDKFGVLIDMLRKSTHFHEEIYQGVSIFISSNMCYCFADDVMIIHTTPNTVMMKKYLDLLQVKRERMSETSHYRNFKKGIKGRALLIQYQDTRWSYAMARGILLLLLPEFSDLTDRMLDYKDAWSSLSVTPDGLQIYFKVYK